MFKEFEMSILYGLYSSLSGLYNFLIGSLTQNSTLFNDAIIKGIVSNVYAVVGIFMLFRVAISLLQMLIDPDKVNDKNVGMGKLIVRIIVAIALFLSLNSIIFPLLGQIQQALIGDGIINRILNTGGRCRVGTDSSGKAIYDDTYNNKMDCERYIGGTWEPLDSTTSSTVMNKLERDIIYDKLNYHAFTDVHAMDVCDSESFYFYYATKEYSDDHTYFHFDKTHYTEACLYDKDAIINVFVKPENLKEDNTWNENYSLNDIDNNFDGKIERRRPLLNKINKECDYSKPIGDQWSCYAIHENKVYDKNKTEGQIGESSVTLYRKNVNDTNAEYGRIVIDVDIYTKIKNTTYNQTCYYAYVGSGEYNSENKSELLLTYLKVDFGSQYSNGAYNYFYTTINETNDKVRFADYDFPVTSASCVGDNCDHINIWGDGKAEGTELMNGQCPFLRRKSNQAAWDTCTPKGTSTATDGTPLNEWECRLQNNDFQIEATSDSSSENSGNNRFTCGSTSLQGMIDCVTNPDYPYGLSENSSVLGMNTINYHRQYMNDDQKQKLDQFLNNLDNKLEQRYLGDKYADYFAGSLLRSFITDNGMPSADKDILKAENILSNQGRITDLYKDNKVKVSSFFGIIVGIIACALIIILAVDIVIRNIKLLILQMISPIAVISYINPNDKIFMTWLKQFGGTFVDLFIKLLGICLIPIAIQIFDSYNSGNSIWLSLIIILGVLAGAKMIPGFISKIFGISDAAGSFKDAARMVKTAAFTSAGVGLAAGAASIGGVRAFHATKGQGFLNRGAAIANALGTGITSVARGAGAGMKGNITGGASYAFKTNKDRRLMYDAGAEGRGVLLTGLSMGLWEPNKKDEEIEAAYDDILNKRKAMDERMQDEILKNKVNGVVGTFNDSLTGRNFALSELKTMISSGKTYDGSRNLTTEEVNHYNKLYSDSMDLAKARYLTAVRDGTIDDAQTKSFMEIYDRTVDYYSQKYGSHTDSRDTSYTYDFTSLTKTNDITTATTDAAKRAAWKKSKSTAEDGKTVFTNSETRGKHRTLKNQNAKGGS